MFSLLRADLFKLRKRAMGWVMLVIVALLVPLIMVGSAAAQPSRTNFSFPGSLLTGVAPLSAAGMFTVVILGATLVGSEYGYDTWKNLLTRYPGRAAFILSKWLVMLIGICFALIALSLLGIALGWILQSTMHLTGRAVHLSFSGVLTLTLAQTLVPIMAGSLAIMGAVLWNSSTSGIVLGIVWYIVDAILGALEPLASAGSSVTALQGQITGVALSSSGGVAPVQLSGLGGALAIVPGLVVIFYLVVPITVAVMLFRKRDMVGAV